MADAYAEIQDRTRVIHSTTEKLMLYLFFVTEKDEPEKLGEPVVASAGRTEEDSWRMLASNRQRMTGVVEAPDELRRSMTARGFHVEKYAATPV